MFNCGKHVNSVLLITGNESDFGSGTKKRSGCAVCRAAVSENDNLRTAQPGSGFPERVYRLL